jgi:predicted peptidase
MKPLNVFFIGLLLLLIFQSCGVKRNRFLSKIYQKSGNIALPYNIYYPQAYKKGSKIPLFIFLHGAGERGNDNKRQLTHIAPMMSSTVVTEQYPAVMLWPQCPENDYWAPVKRFEWVAVNGGDVTPSMQTLIHLIEDIIKDIHIDNNRIYLAGLSMGGFGTFDLLSRKPDIFAAAVPICGGADLSKAKVYKHIPLWIFHGAKDPVVSVRLSDEVAEQLKASGATQVKYTVYQEGGHDVWNDAFDEAELLPWLFSQRKPVNDIPNRKNK